MIAQARTWIGLLLLIVLGACASPSSDADPSPAEPTVENRYGAPPITEPRDVTSRAADPCGTLLTTTQLNGLDYSSPGEPDETILGAPLCIYRDEDARRTARVGVEVDRRLLIDTYRERVMPIFIPTVIGGLPATHEKSFPSALTCDTIVGVADDQALSIFTTVESQPVGPPLIDPCEDGARVAEAVVSTLPPA